MRRLLALICFIIPVLAAAKGPKTAMDSFRYELYEKGNCTVYYIHKTTEGTSLYYREAGSLEGWRLASVDNDTIDGFAKIWKKHKLSSREGQSIESEDKTRDRWLVQATFGQEAGHTIIEYLDAGRSEETQKLEDAIKECVHSTIEKQKSSPVKCATSKCIYSKEGTLLKRIDYGPDGKVTGGYDALDPFAEF